MADQSGGNQQSSGPSGYGGYGASYNYGYGGGNYSSYGYGYGDYGGGESEGPTRSFKDYLLMFRERIWLFIITVVVVLACAFVFMLSTTRQYRATATIELLPESTSPIGERIDLVDTDIRSSTDLNTQLDILKSESLVRKVAGRLQDENRKRFLAPFQTSRFEGPLTPEERLARGRKVTPSSDSRVVYLSFIHPDKQIAALIANLFAEEYINRNLELEIDRAHEAVDQLQRRAENQREVVEDKLNQLADYRQKYNEVSISTGDDVMRLELERLSARRVESENYFDDAEARYRQIENVKQEGGDLWDLSFIASEPRVATLLQQIAELNISISSLSERYRSKHPRMIETMQSLRQAEEELREAVASAEAKVRNEYMRARQNLESATRRYEETHQRILDLEKVRVDYKAIESDLNVQRGFYEALVGRMSEELAQANMKAANARIVDRAIAPSSPFKPRPVRIIALGLLAGLGGGIGLVFAVAFLDDRIKTAFDIEGTVGLPLIGIIPRIKRLDASSKAQAVASNVDRHVTEAFRSLYSALKLNDDSKNAKVIVGTSTVPGEGKSFVCSNLALTFANHGERTILVDGDLRLPNVAKSLQLEIDRGLVNHIDQGENLDDVIVSQAYPNLDVLAAGGKAKNPTRIINSQEFEKLLESLRERYDRIIVDSPPLAAVSDALSILPLADGVVYVIKFNSVKTKTAKVNVRRMWDSNTPIFGAVLNNISAGVTSYYYSHYYDSSYRDYYMEGEDVDAESENLQRNAPIAEQSGSGRR